MNRKAIRDLAAIDLSIKTARYKYAFFNELKIGVEYCSFPCVVKPLMSSSGKGQSVIRSAEDIEKAWSYALEGSRGDLMEVIVEEFISFEYEITLLTLTQNNGNTLFCPPIGHRQERGDYQESWQPMPMQDSFLKEAARYGIKSNSCPWRGLVYGELNFLLQMMACIFQSYLHALMIQAWLL